MFSKKFGKKTFFLTSLYVREIKSKGKYKFLVKL